MYIQNLCFRETGAPKRGFGSVLPRHHPDYNKHYLESTHRSDYTPPDKDYVPVPVGIIKAYEGAPIHLLLVLFITKTCRCNIQRYFSAVNMENFIGKLFMF